MLNINRRRRKDEQRRKLEEEMRKLEEESKQRLREKRKRRDDSIPLSNEGNRHNRQSDSFLVDSIGRKDEPRDEALEAPCGEKKESPSASFSVRASSLPFDRRTHVANPLRPRRLPEKGKGEIEVDVSLQSPAGIGRDGTPPTDVLVDQTRPSPGLSSVAMSQSPSFKGTTGLHGQDADEDVSDEEPIIDLTAALLRERGPQLKSPPPSEKVDSGENSKTNNAPTPSNGNVGISREEDLGQEVNFSQTVGATKTPRNPLALMRDRARTKDSSSKGQAQIDDADSLWDDDGDNIGFQGSSRQENTRSKTRSSLPASELSTEKFNKQESPTRDEANEDAEPYPEFDDPKFFSPEAGPLELLPLDDCGEFAEVPTSINQYLAGYQREGVSFMFQCLASGRGSILGDDMGLGKTIQIIALLAALLKKTGTGLDVLELKRRRLRIAEIKRAIEDDLRCGKIVQRDIRSEAGLPAWSPVLLVVPPTLCRHWEDDLTKWGHFTVATMKSGCNKARELEKISNGEAEILICARSLFHDTALLEVDWKLVVIDEFHSLFKNVKGKLSYCLRKLKLRISGKVIGLTGTLMQNNHEELWNLVDLVEEGLLQTWIDFKESFADPIKFSRAKDASQVVREEGHRKADLLTSTLRQIFIARLKEDVLANELPLKFEHIVFCPMTELQKQIYQHLLQLPDFVLVSHANAPCDCGVNTKFFIEYQHKRTKREKIDYQREHKNDLIKRRECCYTIPTDKRRAPIWRSQHPDESPCERCPFCVFWPVLNTMNQLCSHVALLQVKDNPDFIPNKQTKHYKRAEMLLDRAKTILPDEVLERLPGRSYIRQPSILDDHFRLSGKMEALDRLLCKIRRDQGRVLLFSYSTQMLDLIENYVRSRFSHLRIDGSTPQASRQAAVDKFKSDPNIFVFLLSTKAMAVGLNLPEANNVVIFDVEWNPSYEKQAQDRAYRIGQNRDVRVYRLVSRGTVEELKYLRQVYKTQLKKDTILNDDDRTVNAEDRRFRGVHGDNGRKGELFGIANLMKFKDGTFMNYAASSSAGNDGTGLYRVEDLMSRLNNASEEELNELIGEGTDMRPSDGTRAVAAHVARNNDEESEYSDCDLGGESQANIGVFEHAHIPELERIAEDANTCDAVQSIPSNVFSNPKSEECCINPVSGTEIMGRTRSHSVIKAESRPSETQPTDFRNTKYERSTGDPVDGQVADQAKSNSEINIPPQEVQSSKYRETVREPPSTLPGREKMAPADSTTTANYFVVGKSKANIMNGRHRTTFSAKDFPRPKKKSKKT